MPCACFGNGQPCAWKEPAISGHVLAPRSGVQVHACSIDKEIDTEEGKHRNALKTFNKSDYIYFLYK